MRTHEPSPQARGCRRLALSLTCLPITPLSILVLHSGVETFLEIEFAIIEVA